MATPIEPGADALVMDTADHVATALRDLTAGETIRCRIGDRVEPIMIMEAISFGHKLALTDLDAGVSVRKYGEVIGRTLAPISTGSHVHVHNIEGIRGRGDQAASSAKPEGADRV